MAGFDDPGFFEGRWASAHDDLTGTEPAAAVEFLAGLAGPGTRVLELAIGGRAGGAALARRGLQVEGVEASQAVVQRLRAAPGGASLPLYLLGPRSIALVIPRPRTARPPASLDTAKSPPRDQRPPIVLPTQG
jgi:hypothetical protein